MGKTLTVMAFLMRLIQMMGLKMMILIMMAYQILRTMTTTMTEFLTMKTGTMIMMESLMMKTETTTMTVCTTFTTLTMKNISIEDQDQEDDVRKMMTVRSVKKERFRDKICIDTDTEISINITGDCEE